MFPLLLLLWLLKLCISANWVTSRPVFKKPLCLKILYFLVSKLGQFFGLKN